MSKVLSQKERKVAVGKEQLHVMHKVKGADIEGFHFVNDVFCKLGDGKRVPIHVSRVVVPDSLKDELLKSAHDCPLSGHLRVERTLA